MSFPTKDEVADYLEAYAARFGLPVRTGVHVDELTRRGDQFVVTAGACRFEADNVVVASGAHRTPRVPGFAADLALRITQLHSSEYRSPAQLREGGVLVVGVGNSGAEIAYEVARTHLTWLSGKPVAEIPIPHGSDLHVRICSVFIGHPQSGTVLFLPFDRFSEIESRRKVLLEFEFRQSTISKRCHILWIKLKHLAAAGVQQVPRTVGVEDGLPALADGRTLDVSNVIWCTGFRESYEWIDLPIFNADGRPVHQRGVVGAEPGLYFVGLPFQYAVSSDVLPGVGRDAEYIAKQLTSREIRGDSRNIDYGGTLTAVSSPRG